MDPKTGEVLVQWTHAGLCHSDLHFMEGKYPYPCPAVLGHESAGVVEAVGSMVSYVAPGDHVIRGYITKVTETITKMPKMLRTKFVE